MRKRVHHSHGIENPGKPLIMTAHLLIDVDVCEAPVDSLFWVSADVLDLVREGNTGSFARVMELRQVGTDTQTTQLFIVF